MEGEERGEGERACTHSHTRVYILIHRTQKNTLVNILSNIVCTVCASLSVYLCLMFFSYPLVGLMVRISKSLYTHWSWPSKEFYLTIYCRSVAGDNSSYQLQLAPSFLFWCMNLTLHIIL